MTEKEREPALLTVSQAARIFGVHTNTMRKWADRGLVPYIKLPNGFRRFDARKLVMLRDQGVFEAPSKVKVLAAEMPEPMPPLSPRSVATEQRRSDSTGAARVRR